MYRPWGVTRGGDYRHLKKAVAYYDVEHIEAVKEIAEASGNTYGSCRIKAALGAMSYPVSRNKAKQLMKEAGVPVKSRTKCKVITDSTPAKPLFDTILKRDVAPRDQSRRLFRIVRISGHKRAGFTWRRGLTFYSRRVVG